MTLLTDFRWWQDRCLVLGVQGVQGVQGVHMGFGMDGWLVSMVLAGRFFGGIVCE